MKNHNFRRALTLATLPLAFAAVTQAGPSTTVDGRGFDLRKPQDVAALYERIERGAARVCRDASSPWDIRRQVHIRECTAAAISDAVAQANAGALTALHESKLKAARVAQNREK